MKTISALGVILLFILNAASAQLSWVNYRADNRVLVKFPTEPQEINTGTYAAHDKDSVAYFLTVIDFVAVAHIDSVGLIPLKDTNDFAAQLKEGIVSGLPGITLGDFTISRWKGFNSYTTTGVSTDKKTKLYMFMVLIGHKMYSLLAVVPQGASTKGRDDFFASLRLTN
jgi:hypothetical protein